jgi:hypothetical protein
LLSRRRLQPESVLERTILLVAMLMKPCMWQED